VGLIARVVEETGISTVCTTFRRDIIELVRPARVLYLKFPPGKPLGNPGDRQMQRDIIDAGFAVLERDVSDMTIVDLPFKLRRFKDKLYSS
jgi:hypothetical protein